MVSLLLDGPGGPEQSGSDSGPAGKGAKQDEPAQVAHEAPVGPSPPGINMQMLLPLRRILESLAWLPW